MDTINTRLVRITGDGEKDGAILSEAAEILRRGGLVAFPTETVYGLGASAYYPGAAKKVYEAKGRPSDNPLIVHVSRPGEAEDFAVTCPLYYKLAERFMPGPLTVILPKKDVIDPSVTGGLDTVAVRCPSNGIARALIAAAGCPLAAPSANRSGSPSPTRASHVMEDLNGKIDMVIDGGESAIGVESTVIALDPDGGCTVLRPGAVTAEMLGKITSGASVAEAVTDPEKAGDKPKSPGMKYKHYSPAAEVVPVTGDLEKFVSLVEDDPEPRKGVIAAETVRDRFSCTVLTAGERDDDLTYCHSLYGLLREADRLGLLRVYVRLPHRDGGYLALYNRLIRASGGKMTKL